MDLVGPSFDCGAVLGAVTATVVRVHEGDGLDVAKAVARGVPEAEVWSDDVSHVVGLIDMLCERAEEA